MSHNKLNPLSQSVLQYIAAGYSYEQILRELPDITRADIFNSARDALALLQGRPQSSGNAPVRTHDDDEKIFVLIDDAGNNAWQPDEDDHLIELLRQGKSVAHIADVMCRSQDDIRQRLTQLTDSASPSADTDRDIPRIMIQNID